MSESSNRKRKLSPEQVKEYLLENTEFFNQHLDLLTELKLPHDSGAAVSLIERQVSILRERNIEMRHRLSKLLDNARENDRLFDKTKRLVLAMLDCNDLGDLIDAVYYSFDREFKIHYTRIILFGDEQQIPQTAAKVVSLDDARQHLGKRLKSVNPVTGGIDNEEKIFLFDDDADKIGSAAMALLSHGSPLGILAIGNQDPNYYRSNMGSVFLSFISEALNRLLPTYLDK